jgi:hypothetical protein
MPSFDHKAADTIIWLVLVFVQFHFAAVIYSWYKILEEPSLYVPRNAGRTVRQDESWSIQMGIVSPAPAPAASNRSESALPVYALARSTSNISQPYPPTLAAVIVNITDAPPEYKVTDDEPVVRPDEIVATAAMEEQDAGSSPEAV